MKKIVLTLLALMSTYYSVIDAMILDPIEEVEQDLVVRDTVAESAAKLHNFEAIVLRMEELVTRLDRIPAVVNVLRPTDTILGNIKHKFQQPPDVHLEGRVARFQERLLRIKNIAIVQLVNHSLYLRSRLNRFDQMSPEDQDEFITTLNNCGAVYNAFMLSRLALEPEEIQKLTNVANQLNTIRDNIL